MQLELSLPDLAATDRLGELLAAHLPEGAVVALSGTLGAGKTRLVQAIAAACGIDPEEVTSPTFVLCREHHGRRSIYHLDVYRLKDQDEFLQLGVEEMFASGALVFIEWAERVQDFLPDDHVAIFLEQTGESSRSVRIVAHGNAASDWLERLAAAF